MNGAAAVARLSAAEIDAVATLWSRDGRRLTTAFSGTSMLPAIRPGQEVVVECGSEPCVGEVAVFRFDRQIGVHRVVLRAPAWLLTWGDANALPDEPIDPARVIGVVREAPAARLTLRRALILRLLASRRTSIDRLAWRVRLLHRIRNAAAQGPLVFAQKALRALRRNLSC